MTNQEHENGWQAWFTYSAGVILFVMAAGLLIAVSAIPVYLQHRDTLVGLSVPQMFRAIAGVELVLSAYLLAGNNTGLKTGLLVWFFLNLSFYQYGLLWSGLPDYLVCAGNLTGDGFVSPQVAGWIMLLVTGYCLGGGVGFAVWNYWRNRRPASKPDTNMRGQPAQAET